MRGSWPMPTVTASMSASKRSHKVARLLAKDSFMARKKFAAYLVSSALAVSVRTTGESSAA